EIAKRLLQDHRTDFGKKGFLRLHFPLGEFGGCKAIANGFLLLLPCRSAIFQGLIVNIASAAEGFSQLRSLIISREESVFEGLLDYHRNILPLVDGRSNYYLSWAKRPRYQIHLHPSLRLWMEYSLADSDKAKSLPHARQPSRGDRANSSTGSGLGFGLTASRSLTI